MYTQDGSELTLLFFWGNVGAQYAGRGESSFRSVGVVCARQGVARACVLGRSRVWLGSVFNFHPRSPPTPRATALVFRSRRHSLFATALNDRLIATPIPAALL